ncbi:hypothetical protein [Halorubrum vacuolatum]|uniref:hypothetical protein n=1 Tax=Halorubrum vacuolatum TaxID=63740 RepID=UPI0015C63BE8|nr:hypothetical protein [Halorubrum vacuolatum]
MASRQGGPGGGEPSDASTTDRPNAPAAESPTPGWRGSEPTDSESIGRASSGPRVRDRSAALPTQTGRSIRPDRPTIPDRTREASRLGYAPSPKSGRTREDPPLRDPTCYALTDHFCERLTQPGRYVTTRSVSDAIRRGQLRWNRTDGWRFALVRDGVRFVVVVSDTETDSPVVVTAWSEIADAERALASSRFDAVDVDTIAVRSALSESSSTPIPDRIRPRQVTRPFEIGDHRLSTVAGEPYVRCTTCGCRFRSKSEITERRCRVRPATDGGRSS